METVKRAWGFEKRVNTCTGCATASFYLKNIETTTESKVGFNLAFYSLNKTMWS